jgi:hypothetical protein
VAAHGFVRCLCLLQVAVVTRFLVVEGGATKHMASQSQRSDGLGADETLLGLLKE